MRKDFTLNSSQPRKSKKQLIEEIMEFALENAYWSVSEVLYCTTLFFVTAPSAGRQQIKMPDISHILADRSRTLLFFKKKCLKSADHPLLRVFYFFTFFFRSHSYTPFASVTHLLNPGTDISPELCYILPIFHKTLRAARYFLSCAENSARLFHR